jgi:predicted MPP superfamily phosphohydrolase
MRNSPFWWLLIGFMVLLDIYVFQALKVISQPAAPRIKIILFIAYWIISIGAIVLLLILPYLRFEQQAKLFRTTVFSVIAGLFFAKLIASAFFATDDLRRVVQWIAGKIFNNSSTIKETVEHGDKISRSLFLSWAGMLAGGGLFGSLVYGFGNKYRYQLNKIALSFQNLPASFKGLKIAHISDIHCGSFDNKNAVLSGVEKIMSQQPDLIVFTGDLVNHLAVEMDDYMDVFSRLKAPLGTYSVLGNHDYGDYIHWDSREEKSANLQRLKEVHAELGWRLLLNENVTIEKNDQTIALIGVENWSSKARFTKYGDLAKAYMGSARHPFKILLSHDPSHWEAEVLASYSDIDLMLSGHTHGMQFGVEIPGFKWSPVQYVYKQWAGLYEQGNQKLYVNRGFGFIGYPGRVGILPEITLIELT